MTALADRSVDGRRRAALEAFSAAPLPARALHLWRYTDPARLLPGDLPVAKSGLEDTVPIRPGVRVASLAPALDEAEVRERFASLSNEGTGKFEALNLAHFGAGGLVTIAPGARPEAPIEVIHGAAAGSDFDAGSFACPRVLVLVGEGAEASIVEEYGTNGWEPSLVHAVTEVFLAPGARLVHSVVNSFGPKVRANLVHRARLDRAASLTLVSVGLGGDVVKLDASAVLAGEHARSEVLGLSFGTGRQHMDSHFFQDHQAPRTTSDLLVKTALSDRARASYTGQLRIAGEAPGSEAHQENRNLLLSEAARADSIPELEILTHEVQCSHAAATGPVDAAMLFYLRSRGLDERRALNAIVEGFLEPVLARVPGEALQASLRQAAARRLGEG
ncbi:MAG TPA: Fe-S cluster assembly protein SufD [Planctomycetota bacterium]|nr:Fe-S cluster assembly protein SufD [Planctomycetota bacterium]